jgi:hypothetical protein
MVAMFRKISDRVGDRAALAASRSCFAVFPSWLGGVASLCFIAPEVCTKLLPKTVHSCSTLCSFRALWEAGAVKKNVFNWKMDRKVEQFTAPAGGGAPGRSPLAELPKQSAKIFEVILNGVAFSAS